MLGINATEATLLSPADLTKTMDGIHDLGCRYVRIEAPWAEIEPVQGVWNFAQLDAAVNAAKLRGITPLLVLGVHKPTVGFWVFTQPAPWATPTEFGVFCGMIARRYQLPEYEIWNEQNNTAFMSTPGFLWWPGSVSAALYTQHLQAAYNAIKNVQPGGKVLFGGLQATVSWLNTQVDPVSFLKQCYEAGAKGFFDELAYHPYAYTPTWVYEDPTAAQTFIAMVQQLYDVMVAHNDPKSIRLTEWGFPTNASTNLIAETRLSKELPLLHLPFVSGSYLYDFRDYGGDFFGVVDAEYVPKQPIYDWSLRAFSASS